MMSLFARPFFVGIFLLAQTVGLHPVYAADAATTPDRDTASVGRPASDYQAAVPIFAAAGQDGASALAFMSLGGARGSDLDAVRDDMTKRTGDLSKKVKVEVRHDEFFFDGEASGLKISSYQPFRVTFEGRAWTLDANMSAKDNYFSLMKFFDSNLNKHASLSLISKAYASQRVGWAVGGAVVGGTVVGGILYVLGAPLTVPTTIVVLAAAGIGAWLGYKHGYKIDVARQNAAIVEILKAKPKVSCNDKVVILSAKTDKGSFAVRIEKNGSKNPVKISRKFMMANIYDGTVDASAPKYSSFEDSLQIPPEYNSILAKLFTCDTLDGFDRGTMESNQRSRCTGPSAPPEGRAECLAKIAQEAGGGRYDYSSELTSAYQDWYRSLSKPGLQMKPAGGSAN